MFISLLDTHGDRILFLKLGIS